MTDAPDLRQHADAEVEDYLASFDRDVRAAVAALHSDAEAETAALRRLVAETAEAHRRAMESHGFDRGLDEPTRPPTVLWDALTAYRTEMETVHAAFRDGLRALDLGAALGAHYQAQAEALATEAAHAPEVLVRPEPEDLITSQAGDSPGLLARKAAERARRSTQALGRSVSNGLRRLTGKEPHEPELHRQAIPLRDLLTEQTTIRLPGLLVTYHNTAQTEIGQAVARLERSLAVWALGLLRLESGLDRPRFHAADVVAWRVENGEETESPESDPVPVAGSVPAVSSPDASEVSAPTDEIPTDEASVDEIQEQVRRVREIVQALDAALRDAPVQLAPPDETELEAAANALAERVRRSGYDSDRRAAPGEAEPLAELDSDIRRWASWHRQAVQRIGVDTLLLRLRGHLIAQVDALVDRVAEAVLVPVQTTVSRAAEALAALRAEAAEACDRATAPAALAEVLRDLRRRALAVIEDEMVAALRPVSLDRAVEEAVAETRARLAEVVRPLPERVTLHSRLGPDQAGRLGSAADVGLRGVVGELLGASFAERLTRSVEELRQPVLTALAEAEAVRDVVRFNLDTAIEDLEADALGEATGEAELVDDEGEPDVIANARELTVDGLARAEERLGSVAVPLAEPWRAFVRRATEAFEASWTGLHDRVNAENLIAAGLLDLKARTSRTLDRLRQQAERLGARARFALQTWFRFGRIKAKRLVEMGQQAAGLAAQSAVDRQRTLDALAEAATLHAGLPLVYRRLFSFAPLTDPTLFVGRAAELARLTKQAERWHAGLDTSALVVTAEPGGGRTSFLNVLQATVFGADAPARLALTERIETEAEIVGRLGAALGLETDTFGALEEHILAGAAGERAVCLVEGLEHLILRAPGGLDLIERTLICLSRTDTRVLWICTAVQPGWRFVERTAPQVSGLVDTLVLPPLSREEVEAALAKRHARSGLPLVFADPPEPTPLLARRLGKAETPEARQAVLRSEFFDGLYRAGGTGFRLALLYWLRAADFHRVDGEATADTLTLRPVRPLDFAFVGTFDLPRLFALKALLQHGTLTLEEHDRVFRTTREESYLTFESLHNLRLIQRAVGAEARLAPRRNGSAAEMPVEEEARYRLHPLVVAPVTAALRARNML